MKIFLSRIHRILFVVALSTIFGVFSAPLSSARAQTAPVIPGAPPEAAPQDEEAPAPPRRPRRRRNQEAPDPARPEEDGAMEEGDGNDENEMGGEDEDGENDNGEEEEAPPAPVVPEPPVEILLRDALDEDTRGIETNNGAAEIVQSENAFKEGKGALHWSYRLETKTIPDLRLEAGPPLERGRSVSFWLKTSFSGPVAIFFEENGATTQTAPTEKAAEETAANKAAPRYAAFVYSAANLWQEIEIDLARFQLMEDSSGNPRPDWSKIARYGIADATNFWLQKAGQVRVSGPREIWLDDFRVTTARPHNSVAPDGDKETFSLAQDALGDDHLWIPINGTLAPHPRGGAQWDYVRLANHVTSLVMPLDGGQFRDLPEPGLDFADPKMPTSRQGKRNLSLTLEIATQKATKINVAITEKNGAVYSLTQALDPRLRVNTIYFPLYKFKPEGTRPDPNKFLDFADLKLLTISDIGAQTTAAGANQIRLVRAIWSY